MNKTMILDPKFDPIQKRLKIGYALINFFLGISGKKWNDMPDSERYAIIKYAGSIT
jgi:hypothetical protein